MKSIGKLIYEPSSHLGSTKNWLVLMCDDEIGKYYRHLFTLQYPYLNNNYNGKLARPVLGSHISVVRGEKIQNLYLCKKINNKIIEFEYDGEVKDNSEYFWLKVNCPFLNDLRINLGLSPIPKFGLHLTIGRSTNC
jgi:hypothetical protein